jgi:LysM repeat protein
MIASTAILAALLPATALAAPALTRRQGDPQTSLSLDPNNVMKGLENDGQSGPDVTAGQVRSLTSGNNFINFCLTQKVPLTNGVQEKGGSCNQTPMGRIIGIDKMPSSKFVFPENFSSDLNENQPFTISMQIKNVQSGNFVNPATNYYAAPQQVNDQGVVIGHSHVTVEKIDDFKSKNALDPNVFAFFKGLNLPADGKGELSAPVDKGLPAGTYRLCSINAAANHQPVLVAVAQHGSLDDCVYFQVKAGGGGGGGNNGGNGGGNNNGGGDNCAKKATVVGGDTCDSIAQKNGISTDTLRSLNGVINANCNNLGIGQELCVAGGGGAAVQSGGGACKKTVTVVAGDQCKTIAAANKIDTAKLQSLNKAVNAGCTNLSIGQKLCVAN